MDMATWNMQGGSKERSSKWQDGVLNLMNQRNRTLCCLQECGIPHGARNGQNIPTTLNTDPVLYEYQRQYYLLYHEWDVHGHRVNQGVIWRKSQTPNPQNDVRYAQPAGYNGRPPIGVEINGTTYYTIHAKADGGSNVGGLLGNVAANHGGGTQWVVAGDYNREPSTLGAQLPAGSQACPPNADTHPTKAPDKELDYLVKNYGGATTGTVLNFDSDLSDHLPVEFSV